jgi:hypothetical protein
MTDIPASLRYSNDHLWARADAGTGVVRIGVTDFAQQSLGDVVDVTLPNRRSAGHDPADVDDHRVCAPWYTTKAKPSTADMAAKLRRVLIAARFRASRPDKPTPEEISVVRLAWEDPAA